MNIAESSSSNTVVMVVAGANEPALQALASQADLRFCPDEKTVRATIPIADVLLVWDYELLPVLRGRWKDAARLRWIQMSGIGVDGVRDVVHHRHDVLVTNARGIFERAVAEYALALLLTVAKDLPATLLHQARKEWSPRETISLAGRAALVLGAGPIGREIAMLLRGLGMRTVLVARTERHDDVLGRIHQISDLDDLLPEADAVVCALPLTPETTGLLSHARLMRIRSGGMLINVGRGDLVDESALAAAVGERRLRGAACDVFRQEPLPSDSPLWTLAPTFVVSPHMAGEMLGWRQSVAQRFATNLENWRVAQPLVGLVDLAQI